MKYNTLLIIIVVLFVNACGGAPQSPTLVPPSTVPPSIAAPSTATPQPTVTVVKTEAPVSISPTAASSQIQLAAEQRFDDLGFALRPIAGWVPVRTDPFITFAAPGSQPGPSFIVFTPSGSLLQTAGMNIQNLPDALTAFVTFVAPPDAQVSNKQSLTVDKMPALSADVQGTKKDGSTAVVHVVVVLPKANRIFALFAGGPLPHKDEIVALVNTVIATVKLFEPSSSNAPTATALPAPTTASIALGAEQTLPNTTVIYRLPAAWNATPYGLAIIAVPPDADSVTGPSITLAGGAQKDLFPSNSANATLDDLLNSYVSTWLNYGNKAQVANRRDVRVGNALARSAEVTWSTDKYDGFAGRIVVAQPSAGQVFLMLGGGTPDKWQIIAPVMEAMLQAVHFQPK